MSEQLNEKRTGAIRLFGAMSGVDETYLAACEDYKKTKPKGVVVFMQKYGKGMAAVLCLAVLGAGYVSMQQVANSDKEATAMGSAINSVTASRDYGAEAEEAKPESDMQKSNNAMEDYRAEVVGDDFDGTEVKMTLEEAKKIAVVGEYVPDCWPEDGEFIDVLGGQENGAERVYIFWASNNESDYFTINVENLGKEMPKWVQNGLGTYIIEGKEFSKEFVMANSEGISENGNNKDMVDAEFGVLYNVGSDYVLVRFEGRGPVEQICELIK